MVPAPVTVVQTVHYSFVMGFFVVPRWAAVLWYLPPLGHAGEVLMAFFQGTKYPKTHVRPAQRESAVFEL
jgi:hypothetical protein